jgi:DNA repair exonuclease SbcCD nuclease subunit
VEDVLFVPYMPNDKFVQTCLQYNPKTLVCHQTFDGSKYENGFFAPDGIDPGDVEVPVIISGHIHSQQVVSWAGGYIQYIGSPRWRTMSDVNEKKHVVLWDTSTHTYNNFPTSEWCSPMQHVEVSGVMDLARISQHPNTRVYVDAVAPKSQLEALVALIKQNHPKARVRPVSTDRAITVAGVAESQGVSKALSRYLTTYTPKHGTDPGVLRDMIVRELAMEIL